MITTINYASPTSVKQNTEFNIVATNFIKVVSEGTLPQNVYSVYAPLVYKENGMYYMLYGGEPEPKNSKMSYRRHIFVAKSPDGVNWYGHKLVYTTPKGGQVLHGPCSIIKRDGKYYYYYDKWYHWNWATHLAIGKGKNLYDCEWNFSPNMVFFSELAENNCDYKVAIHPKVIKKDNTYHMWITVYSHKELQKAWVEHTTSLDGINWVKSKGVIRYDTFGGLGVYTPSWFQMDGKWFGLVLCRSQNNQGKPGLMRSALIYSDGHPSEEKYSFADFTLPMGLTGINIASQSIFKDTDGEIYVYYVVILNNSKRCIYRAKLIKQKSISSN